MFGVPRGGGILYIGSSTKGETDVKGGYRFSNNAAVFVYGILQLNI